MATDLNNLKDMLNRADIEFREDQSTAKRAKHILGQPILIGEEETPVTVLAVERGYAGFVSEFAFDKWGKLLNMGAWE